MTCICETYWRNDAVAGFVTGSVGAGAVFASKFFTHVQICPSNAFSASAE